MQNIEEADDELSLVGCRYGWLVVLRPAPPSRECGCPRWRCACDCGTSIEVTEYQLLNNLKTRCGCSTQAVPRDAMGKRKVDWFGGTALQVAA